MLPFSLYFVHITGCYNRSPNIHTYQRFTLTDDSQQAKFFEKHKHVGRGKDKSSCSIKMCLAREQLEKTSGNSACL